MKWLSAFLWCGVLLFFGSFGTYAYAHGTLEEVFIVTNHLGDETWSGEITPGPVAHNKELKLRVVARFSGTAHSYYWGPDYGTESVSNLNGGTRTVYAWPGGHWGTPTVTWKKVMPHMNNSDWDRSVSNDPWNPSYDAYTNVVPKDTAETNPCECSHNHRYSFPGADEGLGESFGICIGGCPVGGCPHTHSKYRGVYSHTNEGDGCDIIEYEQTTVSGTWQITESSSTEPGTRHYRVSQFEYQGVTKYTRGKENTSNVSNLVYAAGDDDAYERGIRTEVTRIVRKSDNSNAFLSHVKSHEFVPWIYGSWGVTQADKYIGFDCADLLVASARHAGNSVSFGSANSLTSRTAIKASGEPYYLQGSVVKDKNGSDANIMMGTDIDEGDLILIDRNFSGSFSADHATALYDSDGDSKLDGDDTLIHATHGGVEDGQSLSTVLDAGDKFVLRVGWE